jgi:HK97 family phage major capsid protein
MAIMNAAAKIAITRNTALSLILTDVLAMLARLRVSSDGSVKWFMNRMLIPQLGSLNLAVGTGGAPVFIPSNDASKGMPATLYGYPIQFTEYCKSLGTAGDVILGDFSQYEIADLVSGPEAMESMHVKFLEAQTAYRIIKYVDGQVGPKKVFTPKNGDTLAPFVHITTKLS